MTRAVHPSASFLLALDNVKDLCPTSNHTIPFRTLLARMGIIEPKQIRDTLSKTPNQCAVFYAYFLTCKTQRHATPI